MAPEGLDVGENCLWSFRQAEQGLSSYSSAHLVYPIVALHYQVQRNPSPLHCLSWDYALLADCVRIACALRAHAVNLTRMETHPVLIELLGSPLVASAIWWVSENVL